MPKALQISVHGRPGPKKDLDYESGPNIVFHFLYPSNGQYGNGQKLPVETKQFRRGLGRPTGRGRAEPAGLQAGLFGFVREELVNEVCIRATRFKHAC